jgi:hypothetical protein
MLDIPDLGFVATGRGFCTLAPPPSFRFIPARDEATFLLGFLVGRIFWLPFIWDRRGEAGCRAAGLEPDILECPSCCDHEGIAQNSPAVIPAAARMALLVMMLFL